MPYIKKLSTVSWSDKNNKLEDCPRKVFEEKHMNYHNLPSVPNAQITAEVVANRRYISLTSQTNENTIFMTGEQDMSFVQDVIHPNYCRFEWSAHKYNCSRRNQWTNKWTCTYKGIFLLIIILLVVIMIET